MCSLIELHISRSISRIIKISPISLADKRTLGDIINNRYDLVAVGGAKTLGPDHFSVAVSVVQKQIVWAGTEPEPALLIYHKVSFSRKVIFVCSSVHTYLGKAPTMPFSEWLWGSGTDTQRVYYFGLHDINLLSVL